MWTCDKCATRHEQPDQIKSCQRQQRKNNAIMITIVVGALAVIGAIDVAWNQYVYGDWRCAFAKCVKVSK